MALDTVNRITEMRTDPGGKGINVSKQDCQLGGDSRAVGILVVERHNARKVCRRKREFLTTEFRFVEGQTARISKSLTGSATRIPTSTSRG